MSRKKYHRVDFTVSQFYCCKCGKKGIDIARRIGHYRGPGHLKKLYCIYCKQEWNHVEIRPMHTGYTLEDFELERRYSNFDEEGNRIRPYKEIREEEEEKKNG